MRAALLMTASNELRRLPVAPHRAEYVADLAERHLRPERLHHHRHDVLGAAAGLLESLQRGVCASLVALAPHLVEPRAGDLVGVVDAGEAVDLERRHVIAEVGDADDDAPPVILGLLLGYLVVACAGVQPAGVERREEAAAAGDLLGELPAAALELGGQCLDVVGAAERIGDGREVRLVLQDLLDPHGHLVRVLAGNRDRLVVTGDAERLRAAEHRRERHQRAAHDVIDGLLVGHHRPARHDVDPHPQRTLVGDAVALAQQPAPHLARGAQLGRVLENVHRRAEVDAADARRGGGHVHPAAAAYLVEVFDRVRDHRAEFLIGVEAGVAAVVAGDRHRDPLRQVLGAEFDDVGVEPEAGRGRHLLLRDTAEVRQEEVALPGPREAGEVDAAAARDRPVGGERERPVLHDATARMAVGRLDRDAVERHRDFADALHHGAGLADVLPPCDDVRMVDVVEVVGRIAIVLHQEAGFAVLQQELDALVLVLGLAEARQLEDPPRLGAIALREAAAVERRLAGQATHDRTVVGGHVVRAVGCLERDARPGRVKRGRRVAAHRQSPSSPLENLQISILSVSGIYQEFLFRIIS